MTAAKKRCPACGKPAAAGARWLPFCSERCRLKDLGQWFAGSYSIPADPEADESPEPPPRQ